MFKLLLADHLLPLVFFKLSKIHAIKVSLHLRVSLVHGPVIFSSRSDIFFIHLILGVEIFSLLLGASFKGMRTFLLLVNWGTWLRHIFSLNHYFCNLRFRRSYFSNFCFFVFFLNLDNMLSNLLLPFVRDFRKLDLSCFRVITSIILLKEFKIFFCVVFQEALLISDLSLLSLLLRIDHRWVFRQRAFIFVYRPSSLDIFVRHHRPISSAIASIPTSDAALPRPWRGVKLARRVVLRSFKPLQYLIIFLNDLWVPFALINQGVGPVFRLLPPNIIIYIFRLLLIDRMVRVGLKYWPFAFRDRPSGMLLLWNLRHPKYVSILI